MLQAAFLLDQFREGHPMRFDLSARMLRCRRWLGAAVLLCGLGCTGGQSDAPAGANSTPTAPSAGAKRLILLTNGNSPFWDACRAGVTDAEKELGLPAQGFQAVMEVNDGSVQGQLDKLRQYGGQADVVGIGISALDAKNVGIAEELQTLRKKGIAIITIDSDIDREMFRDARFAFVGTDNFAGGQQLGVCAKQLLPEGGQYVTFVGKTGAQNAIDRINGFADGAGDKFQSVDNMGDDFDRTMARDNVRNAIRNHPDLKALVGIYSYNAPAIVDVVKELNKRDAYKVVVFDAEPIAIQQVGEGMIDAMVVQNPYQMGYQGIKLLRALAQDDKAAIAEMFPKLGEPGGDIYDTGIKVVVPDEGSPLKREDFNANTEFLKLGEFQQWLQKYNLTGS
jgi:ribose transport system substrate-binding protein